MKKRAFITRSLGLYEYTDMPFGLSNVGSSFCHLMKQCLGDQQFVILLLYLDDICIYALSIDVMLAHIELVFNRLKEYHLKVKPKNCHFLTSVLCSGAMFYQLGQYQLTPKSGKGAGLAHPHKCKRSTFLLRTCFLLLEVHSKICLDGLLFT